MNDLQVVFGTGPLALAVMRALRAQGKPVRMINRSGRARFAKDLDTQVGGIDATDPRQTREVCEGAAAVFHCIGLPYAEWQHLPAIAEGIIAGAASANAPLVYGDNLYMYGKVSSPMHEDLPDAATTRKGRIRSAVAQRLLQAHRHGQTKVAIGRGADFFGPHATSNAVMGSRVFGRALAGKPAQLLGNPDKLHTYTYVDDFARALVTLAQRDDALGGIWHVPSAPAISSRQFVELVYRAAGRKPKLSAAPRLLVKVLGRFSAQMRELEEMLYQFDADFVMDSSRFEHTFDMRPTPLEDAISATLAWFRAQDVR